MTCRDIGGLLDLYVEGELDATQSAEVEAHLGECDLCRQRVTSLEQMSDVLAKVPAERPAPDLVARILVAVEAEVSGRPASLRHCLPAALGALTAMLVVIWLGAEAFTTMENGSAFEFLAFFTAQPEALLAYPADALAALIEALPVVEVLLMLVALGLALFLGQRAIAQMPTGHRIHMNGRA